ncbi:uncharacterized protein BT62DRAFT_922046 [Guyanagaster necrorhizus]|uniref:Uncharacterized protein n=1 Tax=Guyanagaster necrorhizus TaxID=856835 RepID=A0A9P7VMN7_9AGAR|nr:uncharacterized protein BT62DRAFT_922046 [Guyanagaster necrorhizus MCA 3950]KAG7443262.1 hypothetical protein BT62DRAFT_922046 [Guyanagaster necrorhizus MCA 3950]
MTKPGSHGPKHCHMSLGPNKLNDLLEWLHDIRWQDIQQSRQNGLQDPPALNSVLWKIILMEVEVPHTKIYMQQFLRMQWYLDASVAIARFKAILVLTALIMYQYGNPVREIPRSHHFITHANVLGKPPYRSSSPGRSGAPE